MIKKGIVEFKKIIGKLNDNQSICKTNHRENKPKKYQILKLNKINNSQFKDLKKTFY